MHFTFTYADKALLSALLPPLFDILYENSPALTDTLPTAREKWIGEVLPALEKTPWQLILMLDGEKTVGFFQYYVAGGVLMMEEIQIRREYHGSGIFRGLYEWLVCRIPDDTEYVEAYAEPHNLRSQAILSHLGLVQTETTADGRFLHFRGSYSSIREKYGKI